LLTSALYLVISEGAEKMLGYLSAEVTNKITPADIIYATTEADFMPQYR